MAYILRQVANVLSLVPLVVLLAVATHSSGIPARRDHGVATAVTQTTTIGPSLYAANDTEDHASLVDIIMSASTVFPLVSSTTMKSTDNVVPSGNRSVQLSGLDRASSRRRVTSGTCNRLYWEKSLSSWWRPYEVMMARPLGFKSKGDSILKQLRNVYRTAIARECRLGHYPTISTSLPFETCDRARTDNDMGLEWITQSIWNADLNAIDVNDTKRSQCMKHDYVRLD